MDLYAVIGHPISHSKSPFIHAEFAKQTQQALQYIAIESPLNSFMETLHTFRQQGGKGCSITLPFKETAWQIVNIHSTRAELAGAVNTIVFREDGQLYGDNTDGVGLVRDITVNHHMSLYQKHILLIGAGGAARGVIKPLLDEKPAQLIITNRTFNKCQDLITVFNQYSNIQACKFAELTNFKFDVIINATSTGVNNENLPLPNDILNSVSFCYEMMYGRITPFMNWAEKQQATKINDGLGMLVEQAAEAFFIWRHVKPNTQAIIRKLENA